jgi:hypothetical protein
MDIDAFVQNFTESEKGGEDKEEEENGTVIEEEKCRVNTLPRCC